jgi:hypothetical protein
MAMIGDSSKNFDDELVKSVKAVLGQKKEVEVRLWFNAEEHLDPDDFQILKKTFPKFRVAEVKSLDYFERNNTTAVMRSDYSIGGVCLPALAIVFEDPENPSYYYFGFIEGKKNVTQFIVSLAVNIKMGSKVS